MTDKKSLTNKTSQGFLWLSSGKGFQAILQVIVLAILARLISPESFGVAQASLIVIGFANLISQMGVGPALVQRRGLNQYHLRTGFTFSFILGLILGVVTYFSADILANFFSMSSLEDVLKVVSLIFVIESFVVVSESLLQKKMKFKEYAFVNIISYTLGYGIVGIALGYMNYGVWALIIAYISQSTIKAFIVSILEPHSYKPSLKIKELKELLYFGGGFTVGKFANYLAGQGDNIMIGKFLGSDSLGLYSRAYAIMVKPASLIGTALDKALFPAMSKVQGDKVKLANAYLKGISSLAYISLPVSLLIFLSAPEVVNILLGEQWIETIVPLKILSVGLVFRMGYKMGDSLARATGAVYRRAWRQIIFALAVLIGGYLGSFWGIEGVALATVFAVLLNYILMAHLSLLLINGSWLNFYKSHIKGMQITILIGLVYYPLILLCRYLDMWDILTLLCSFMVTALFTGYVLYIYPNIFLNKDVSNALLDIRNSSKSTSR